VRELHILHFLLSLILHFLIKLDHSFNSNNFLQDISGKTKPTLMLKNILFMSYMRLVYVNVCILILF